MFITYDFVTSNTNVNLPMDRIIRKSKNAGLTINRFVTVTASDIKLFLTLTITVTKTSMVQSSLNQGLTKTNLFQTTSYDG